MSSLAASKLFDIKGWVCLVTGGGTGIGAIIAETLAASGATVYITGRRKEVIEDEAKHAPAGGKIVPIQMDVNNVENVQEVAKEIAAKESHLNLLVNNAGINTDPVKLSDDAEALSKEMLKQDPAEWAKCFQTNITSVFFVSAAFLPLLKKATPHPGSIVNTASISGLMKSTQQGQFAYNTSKAATVQLTNLLASDLRHLKIRVNSLNPGYFLSEMTSHSHGGDASKELEELMKSKGGVPLDRAGTPEDMGQAILSLAVNQYMTGQHIAVDGGVLLDLP